MQTVVNENVEQRVRTITMTILGLDQVDILLDARFREELGADSLDLVDLIVAFGREFNVGICDAEVQHVETIRQVVEYISTKSISVDTCHDYSVDRFSTSTMREGELGSVHEISNTRTRLCLISSGRGQR